VTRSQFICDFAVGELLKLDERVISYDFYTHPTYPTNGVPGRYISKSVAVVVVDKKDITGREYVQVIYEDGVTWLHPTTRVMQY
jgi:hypothetical protein